jgi:catechol 2,3-dioxygenase-like lactoylglutathione lyase family enzyme
VRFDNVRLLVDDLPTCFRFYRDVMGFVVREGDEATTMYAELGIGDSGFIGLYSRDAMAARIGRTAQSPSGQTPDRFALILKTDNCDALVAELKGRGAAFESEPFTEDWGGRTAHLRDPAGNLIELLQSAS